MSYGTPRLGKASCKALALDPRTVSGLVSVFVFLILRALFDSDGYFRRQHKLDFFVFSKRYTKQKILRPNSLSLQLHIETMSTLRFAVLVTPMFAAFTHTAAAAGVWSPYMPSGMEYQLMSGEEKYATAKATCASQAADASLASPSSTGAVQFLYGMSSGETWLGLHNDLVGKPKPCRDYSVFNWDSGMVCQTYIHSPKISILCCATDLHFALHGSDGSPV